MACLHTNYQVFQEFLLNRMWIKRSNIFIFSSSVQVINFTKGEKLLNFNQINHNLETSHDVARNLACLLKS